MIFSGKFIKEDFYVENVRTIIIFFIFRRVECMQELRGINVIPIRLELGSP